MADPTVLDIRQIVDYIKSLPSSAKRAQVKAHTATMLKAESLAKGKYFKKSFTGRHDYTLSGGLMNSIYSGMEALNGITGWFIGVRNIPYGRIHEFGGTIVPKKAKNLWIPQHKVTGKLTPREFMKLKIADPTMYFLNSKVAGKWDSHNEKTRKLIPMFFLVKKVTIPARPYLTPAIDESLESFPKYLAKFMAAEAGAKDD